MWTLYFAAVVYWLQLQNIMSASATQGGHNKEQHAAEKENCQVTNAGKQEILRNYIIDSYPTSKY